MFIFFRLNRVIIWRDFAVLNVNNMVIRVSIVGMDRTVIKERMVMVLNKIQEVKIKTKIKETIEDLLLEGMLIRMPRRKSSIISVEGIML